MDCLVSILLTTLSITEGLGDSKEIKYIMKQSIKLMKTTPGVATFRDGCYQTSSLAKKFFLAFYLNWGKCSMSI